MHIVNILSRASYLLMIVTHLLHQVFEGMNVMNNTKCVVKILKPVRCYCYTFPTSSIIMMFVSFSQVKKKKIKREIKILQVLFQLLRHLTLDISHFVFYLSQLEQTRRIYVAERILFSF